MSWIFGIVTNETDSIHVPVFVEKNYSKKIHFRNVNIFVGGNNRNIHYKHVEDSNSGWIVSGIGFDTDAGFTKIMNTGNWDIKLKNKEQIQSIDGHFIILTWNEYQINIHADYLGLRDIYLRESKDKIIFSTRIDWISEYENIDINFKEFGSSWLLFNQLSDRSIFHNVSRIAAGKEAIIDYRQFKIKYKDYFWLPSFEDKVRTYKDLSDRLESFLNVKDAEKNKISLGLSGGMDSRILLSLLMKKDMSLWDTFTFGDPKHPDSIISQNISSDLGIKHQHINSLIPSIDECLHEIHDYTSYTIVNNPASAILQLRYYTQLSGNKIIIDGGFGEIWRREFLNRLLWKGKRELLNKKIDSIITHLKLERADIFTKEVNEIMAKGCYEQFDELYTKLPSINQIGIGAWLDIFAIKTRLLNYYSQEQSRLDNIVTSFMPFAQLNILKCLFSFPVNQKKNGKLFIKIIKENYPALTKYPRVKSNIAHPFFLNSIQSRLWSLIRTKLKYGIFIDYRRHILLNHLKEFIMDTVNSEAVKSASFYNYNRIRMMSEGYFKGELQNAEPLDWWLSFEILRQKIYQDK